MASISFSPPFLKAPIDRHEAALTIQSRWRRRLVKHSPFIPRGEKKHLEKILESMKVQGLETVVRAPSGGSPVYLPAGCSIVFKKAGMWHAGERLRKMVYLREILQSQGSTHLVIPQARVVQEFIAESKLPIDDDDYYNMNLYLSHLQLFDQPVREMTRLCSKVYFSDWVTYTLAPLGRIPHVEDLVRYDNFPFYLQNGKAYIGLIDTEDIDFCENPRSFTLLARVFPYHLHIIREELRKLDKDVDEEALEEAGQKGKIFLKMGYIDFARWLHAKGISRVNLTHSFISFGPSKLKAIENVLSEYDLSPDLAAPIYDIFEKYLNSLLETNQTSVKSTLVASRTIIVKHTTFRDALEQIDFPSLDRQEFTTMALTLLNDLMTQLAEEGEIFSYIPPHEASGDKRSFWLRY